MELRVGAIYHWLGYEDEDLSRPMISSVEYLGLDVLGSPKPGEESRHFFRLVGSDEKIMFGEKHLPELADVPGLIEQLKEFHAGKHKVPPWKR